MTAKIITFFCDGAQISIKEEFERRKIGTNPYNSINVTYLILGIYLRCHGNKGYLKTLFYFNTILKDSVEEPQDLLGGRGANCKCMLTQHYRVLCRQDTRLYFIIHVLIVL